MYNVSRTCFPIHSILGIGVGGSCPPSACYLHNADVYVSPVVDYSGIVWHDDIIIIYIMCMCVCVPTVNRPVQLHEMEEGSQEYWRKLSKMRCIQNNEDSKIAGGR